MSNNRIFWACEAVGVAPQDSTSYVAVHGVQSLSMTTTFNLEQAFELGQIELYENIENIPDVEVTIEKVLDGYPLLYHHATRGATTGTLTGRSARKCNLALSIFGDTQDSASGTPQTEVICSGMYLSSVTYTLPVEGNCTESVTLVGNNKEWKSAGFSFTGNLFVNTDVPLAYTSGWGGIQRRENVKFGSLLDGTVTLLPSGTGGVRGISSSGTNDLTGSTYGCHLQGITISTNLGREAVYELGRKTPYYRFVNFPVEVTTEISALATDGDYVSATETGVAGGGSNLTDQRILVVMEDGTKFDTGSKNKLSNVTYGGGDAGGGNVTVTYTYSTFNNLTVTHLNDPS